MVRPETSLAETPDGAFRVVLATREDLAPLLSVQREAFTRVAHDAGVPISEMPPVQEQLAHLEGLYEQGASFFIALDASGRIVGTVRGTLVGDTVEIGRLAVAVDSLRRGVARALMSALEDAFPDARRFDLFTGAEAAAPIALYGQLGYSTYATEQMGPWTLIRMAKTRPGD